MGKEKKLPTYSSIFFVWSVPGLILVVIGYLTDRVMFSNFGVALLSIGVIYYGKMRRHNWVWYAVWLTLFFVYISLAFFELLKS